MNDELLLFTGNSHPLLAERVAELLGSHLCYAAHAPFNDGESKILIGKEVREKTVIVLQSLGRSLLNSINDNVMETYLMIRTLKRNGARRVILVLPYFGYGRQDRMGKERVSISAADIALLLEGSGADRLITVDLHCEQIQGFFPKIPVDHLSGIELFAPEIASANHPRPLLVSPDMGGCQRTHQLRDLLAQLAIKMEMVVIIKTRSLPGMIASMDLVGDVTEREAIMFDDICDTGRTLVQATNLLKQKGVRKVIACITHPLFSGEALTMIAQSSIDLLLISDTLPLREPLPGNVRQLSIAPLLCKAIRKLMSP